jgi:hypothetical protein
VSGVIGDMFTTTLLLSALASAACLVVDQDLRQPDMTRSLVFSGDAYDNEMGVASVALSGRRC